MELSGKPWRYVVSTGQPSAKVQGNLISVDKRRIATRLRLGVARENQRKHSVVSCLQNPGKSISQHSKALARQRTLW
jgi:hypothetical protein